MSPAHRTSVKTTFALVAAVSLSVVLKAPAEEKTITLKDAPSAVQKTIADQLKGGKLRGLSVEVEDGKTQYEAELTVDGRQMDMIIDPAGKIVLVETLMDMKALPEAVRAGFTREAGKGTITRTEEISKSGVINYEALIKEAGKKDREVVLSPDGKLIPAKK